MMISKYVELVALLTHFYKETILFLFAYKGLIFKEVLLLTLNS